MSFFRTPIDEEVQKALFRRIEAVSNKKYGSDLLGTLEPRTGEKGDPFENEFAKMCWARVVTIDDDGGEGKPIFLNSLMDNEGKSNIFEPLNFKNGYNSKYRGRSGITAIESSFKEFFLKQSTITWTCPDPNEFDEVINKYFLKHGRYVLIEFGWSTRNKIVLDSITTENMVGYSKNLDQRNRDGGGNYNAMVGVITNYNFDLQQDGSYQGTFEVSSLGRNIFGQRIQTDGKIENLVQYATDQTLKLQEKYDKDEELNEEEKEQRENLRKLRRSFVDFYSVIENLDDVVDKYIEESDGEFQTPETPREQFADTFTEKLKARLAGMDTAEDPFGMMKHREGALKLSPIFEELNISVDDDSGQGFLTKMGHIFTKSREEKVKDKSSYFVTWGWFEDFILNSFFAFNRSDEDNSFKTNFLSADDVFETDKQSKTTRLISRESTKCLTNKNLYTIGLNSIILPGKIKAFDANKYDPERDSDWSASLGDNTISFYDWLARLGGGVTNVFTKKIGPKNWSLEVQLLFIFKFMNEYFRPFESQKNGKTVGNIRDMVFNVEYLKSSFQSSKTIEEAMYSFWNKVSADYGGYWRFSVIEDENIDGRIKVVDLNQSGEFNDDDIQEGKISTPQDPTKVFKFPVFSHDSIVSDINLSTAYDSEMATLAVVGSNADIEVGAGDVGKGYTELAVRALSLLSSYGASKDMNDGDKKMDAILKELTYPYYKNTQKNGSQRGASGTTIRKNDVERFTGIIPDNPDFVTYGKTKTTSQNHIEQSDDGGIQFNIIPELTNTKDKIVKDIEDQASYDTSEAALRQGYYWFNTTDRTVQIYSARRGEMLDEFKRTMLYYINKDPNQNNESNYTSVKPIVPLTLSLTIQGIGGIKIGDLFYVDYLPEIYREYCHWLIVNVEHSVSSDGWTTKLDSRMVVDIPKLYREVKGKGFETREFKPFMVKPGQDLSERITELRRELKSEQEQQGIYTDRESDKIKEYQERIAKGTKSNVYNFTTHNKYLKEYPMSYEEFIKKNPQYFPTPNQSENFHRLAKKEGIETNKYQSLEVIDSEIPSINIQTPGYDSDSPGR